MHSSLYWKWSCYRSGGRTQEETISKTPGQGNMYISFLLAHIKFIMCIYDLRGQIRS